MVGNFFARDSLSDIIARGNCLHAAPYSVKRFWLLQLYFSYLSCIPFVYVHDTKFKECLEFEQCVVEKLPSLVKLVSPFRKPSNQHV